LRHPRWRQDNTVWRRWRWRQAPCHLADDAELTVTWQPPWHRHHWRQAWRRRHWRQAWRHGS
jgi:hypothetical protein